VIRWAVAFLLLASPAVAHTNCDGSSASKVQGCCGPEDSLHVSPGDVSRDGDVWYVKIDGAMHALINGAGNPIQLMPQDDQGHGSCYTVWYRREVTKGSSSFDPNNTHGGSGDVYHFYCFQGPYTF